MNVLIIRIEAFPYGSAPASRTMHFSKLVAECGNNVCVCAPEINIDDVLARKWKLDYPTLMYFSAKEIGCSIEKAVDNFLCSHVVDVIVQPSSIRNFTSIQKIIKKHGVRTILDAVEWHNAGNWRLGNFDPRYYHFLLYWRYIFTKEAGIVAISRMIERYYLNHLDNVVRIPTITDCNNTEYRTKVALDGKIRFIFCGMVDKNKDCLKNLIEALDSLDESVNKIQLDVYGPTITEFNKHMGVKRRLLAKHRNIILHGKVSQVEAQKACYDSDFSVFFRQNRRSANAGFPTKLGECMTFGTPAFCNNTGDISLVIQDGVNGFLLISDTVTEIRKALIKILCMSIEEREEMRHNARITAESFFDYRNYKAEMKCVLYEALKK